MKKRTLTLLVLSALLVAAPALARGTVAVDAGLVTFETAKAQLRITGPAGFVHEGTIDGAYSFAPVSKAGAALADGVYSWELVPVAPRVKRGEAPITPLEAQSGHFAIRGGSFVVPTASGSRQDVATKDQVIPDDLIVQGSACVGLDCVNNENFGFDTIRLKENNLRIHFDDTSTQAGFPANDWRLIANDSASGGQSKFSIEDSTGARTPFTTEAGATTNSIYVDSTGRVGFRTSTPVLDLHVNTSNTPGIRLEQNSSGGFTAQTWDIAGNEANFFVRDVTGGSLLSFRIRPGAPTSSVDISSDGDVGVGTAGPAANLEVEDSVAAPTQPMLLLDNINGPPRLEQRNGAGGHTWRQTVTGSGEFNIDDTLDGIIEASFAQNGNLTISGNVITSNCPAGCGPDYVFAPDYELMSLDELGAFVAENKHLPNVTPAVEMETNGINMTQLQLQMLEKIEELTLYTLGQHETIQAQQATIDALRAEKDQAIGDLAARLAALEAAARAN